MLVRLPTTQAAMAATSRVKKSGESSWANRGAMSTPARLARMLARIHDDNATRSASTPCSCSSRGLSTTARMRRPSAPRRNSTTRKTTTPMVHTMVAIWLASSTYWPDLGHRKSKLSRTGHSGGGFSLLSLPMMSWTIWGMATSRPSEVISLASGVAVR